MSSDEAVNFAMEVHTKGQGATKPTTFEIAETQAYEAINYARAQPEPQPLSVKLLPVEE